VTLKSLNYNNVFLLTLKTKAYQRVKLINESEGLIIRFINWIIYD